MEHKEMRSLIRVLVRKVDNASGGAGADAAIHAIVNGLQEYVSDHEADLVEHLDEREPVGAEGAKWEAALKEEIRLWSHMYGVLDKAGLKLRAVPRRSKKRGRAKPKPAGLAVRKATREAMRRALRGT